MGHKSRNNFPKPISFLFAAGILLLCVSIPHYPVKSQPENSDFSFIRESPLSVSEKLSAMRFLQSKIIQPEKGYYLVRSAHALHRMNDPLAVFAYLVTFELVKSEEGYDLGDSYSVAGYYVVFLTRSGSDYSIIDEFAVTPPELLSRLQYSGDFAPPEISDDPEFFDYTGPLFSASSEEIINWQNELAKSNFPRFEFTDLTSDSRLDFVVDIEGFEFQPTSYYTVMVGTSDGFIEGFRTWGYNTDYYESELKDSMRRIRNVVIADEFISSEDGSWMKSWRDHFIWENDRFLNANPIFPDQYSQLKESLSSLVSESLRVEIAVNSRWRGMNRYEINATRFSEGLGTPFKFYFNLAKIAEYQSNSDEARELYQKIIDYLNEEYDAQESMNLDEINSSIRDVVYAYEEWRDEIYSASEAALFMGE